MNVADALAAWAAFPIHADTRPLVITGPLLHGAGFVSSEAKIAFHERRMVMADGVPAAAATSLTAEIGPLTSGPGQVLSVLHAVLGRHPFRTDRGPCELDAWSLDVSDGLEPIIVVDADERARMWPVPGLGFGAGTAYRLDPSDTRLQYHFVGSPRRYDDYDGAEVTAGETAVAVSPRRVGTGRGNGIRLAYAETRHVEFSLAAPLGPRVLIDGVGNPIAVLDGEK